MILTPLMLCGMSVNVIEILGEGVRANLSSTNAHRLPGSVMLSLGFIGETMFCEHLEPEGTEAVNNTPQATNTLSV